MFALDQKLPCLQLCGYPWASADPKSCLRLEAGSMRMGNTPALASSSPSDESREACSASQAHAPAGSVQMAQPPPVSSGGVSSSPLSYAGDQPLGRAMAGRKRPRAEGCDGSQGPKQASAKPVLVDFGSVGCMGLLGNPSRLLKVLQSALSTAGLRAVLLTGWLAPAVHFQMLW